LHQAVCAEYGLPLAWRVEIAKDAETSFAVLLLESVKARGFRPEAAVMDMGYDLGPRSVSLSGSRRNAGY
jgi:hypothetical protein